MFMIKNELGQYFSGFVCGVCVWKSHHTRGCIYQSKSSAEYDIAAYGLSDDVFIVEDFDID